ncbi:MAG: PocR ligand-binding domain-containing protein [Anaerolineae bacterium]
MDDLLTTKQLQELLQVDRITIYRMLNDGRLQGFKVGGQWRFSRHEIEAWLQEQQSKLDPSVPSSPDSELQPSPQTLPLSCVEAIQGVCAEALEIAAVTTDLEGTPLTVVSNSCTFCDLILSTERGRRRCARDWRRLGNGQAHTCHAGLLCITAPIEVGGQMVAITAGCQFATAPSERWQEGLADLAAELALRAEDLEEAAASVRTVPQEELPRVSRLLQRVVGTFSEIGQERLNLLGRLQHIAEVSKIS